MKRFLRRLLGLLGGFLGGLVVLLGGGLLGVLGLGY